jgi:hypothetical protein
MGCGGVFLYPEFIEDFGEVPNSKLGPTNFSLSI